MDEHQNLKASAAILAESMRLKSVADHIDPQGAARIAELERFCAELGRELETVQRERLAIQEESQRLLAIAKENHGFDDPLHLRAMPDCWQCAAITQAESVRCKPNMNISQNALGDK